MTTPESWVCIAAVGMVLTGTGALGGLWVHRKLWRRP